jgi:hypothetical protein
MLQGKFYCFTLSCVLIIANLTYFYRDWFVVAPTPIEQVRDELLVEKTLRQAAEQRAQEEVNRRLRIERERDVYKVLSLLSDYCLVFMKNIFFSVIGTSYESRI